MRIYRFLVGPTQLTRSAIRLLLVVLLLLSFSGVLTARSAPDARADVFLSQDHGFDTCGSTTTHQMLDIWNNTAFYWNLYVYLGGSNTRCWQPTNITSSWLKCVTGQTFTNGCAMGWGVVFTWVGPQMPISCQDPQSAKSYSTYVSLNTTTAYSQGYNEAVAAYQKVLTLTSDTAQIPIAYDLEGYAGGTSCRAAAKSLMKGWADYLGVSPSQLSGAYGSACGSYLNDFASNGNPPDFIWGADWDNAANTSLPCVPSTRWVNHQRHKQYVGPHMSATYGDTSLKIDTDCADANVYWNGLGTSGPCA